MPMPETLDAAIEALDKLLGDEDRDHILRAEDPGKAVVRMHHSLGRHIRNEWGLWQGSALAQFMRARGTSHPDDMSHEIIMEWVKSKMPTIWQRIMHDKLPV